MRSCYGKRIVLTKPENLNNDERVFCPTHPNGNTLYSFLKLPFLPLPMHLTPRQHIISYLRNNLMSAKDLASKLGLPERDIEHHLYHVRKSLHRQPHQYFHMVFPICWDCQYEFKARTKITRPSRCPQCKSEDISSPRDIRQRIVNTGFNV